MLEDGRKLGQDISQRNQVLNGTTLKLTVKGQSYIEAGDVIEFRMRPIDEKETDFVDAFNLKDKVVDTTGAGDAFNGAFAYALSKNLKDKDALEFANKVAGISTTRVGAANAMPNLDEVEVY